MKISIILTIYKDKKKLSKYLDRASDFEGNNHEFIFVVETKQNDCLKIIDEYRDELNVPVKVVYNTRRRGIHDAIMQAAKMAEGDYIMIHWLTYYYQKDFVLKLISEAENKRADIIEFRPYISSPIKWKPEIRKKVNKVTEIKSKPEIFAYTFPFRFNKIFSRDLFEKIKLVPTLNCSSNFYAIELVFKLFLVAKTYVNCSMILVRSRKNKLSTFNPLKILKEYELMISSDMYKRYIQEIQYSKFFAENIIYVSLVSETKNKVLINKYKTKISKYYANNEDFFLLNKYYLANNREAIKLREIRNESMEKTHKDFDE